MAFSRDTWGNKVRDNILAGSLGEYAKLVISRNIGVKDYWSDEVVRLLSKLDDMMDKNKIKV